MILWSSYLSSWVARSRGTPTVPVTEGVGRETSEDLSSPSPRVESGPGSGSGPRYVDSNLFLSGIIGEVGEGPGWRVASIGVGVSNLRVTPAKSGRRTSTSSWGAWPGARTRPRPNFSFDSSLGRPNRVDGHLLGRKEQGRRKGIEVRFYFGSVGSVMFVKRLRTRRCLVTS